MAKRFHLRAKRAEYRKWEEEAKVRQAIEGVAKTLPPLDSSEQAEFRSKNTIAMEPFHPSAKERR